MSMRFSKYSGAVALAVAAFPFAGCFNTEQTCEDLANCPGGKSAGTGGSAGQTGTGGTAARGGQSGETGAAGATGGTSGWGNGATGGTSANGGTAGLTASGGAGVEAGNGGEGGIAAAGTGAVECDPTKAPSDDICVIDEQYGVFVSPTGHDDTGNGSRSKPYATLTKAITKAKGSTKRVYACADAGSYRESLDLDATTSGLEIYGGFSCNDWHYSTTSKSRLASDTSLALHADSVTGLLIEDLQIDAADATTPGESSIGAFVTASSGVVFRRVQIDAGLGKDGANGTRTDFVFPLRTDLDGNSTTSGTGAEEKVCACPSGATTSGGLGGTAALGGGQSGSNGTPDWGGGKGGAVGTCNPDSQKGSDASSLTGAGGAGTLGTLTSSGWTATSGTDGADGPPGQGGGGGASSTTGGGGGGGCGACGGAGGNGGQGGGASIALAVVDSDVTLDQTDLVATDAGKGGDGIAGQVAQVEGGFGGAHGTGACDGGAGGLGADGAASGGGAGGISVGVLWSGDTAPVQTHVTISTGAAGTKGTGGDPGVNDGVAGTAKNVLKPT